MSGKIMACLAFLAFPIQQEQKNLLLRKECANGRIQDSRYLPYRVVMAIAERRLAFKNSMTGKGCKKINTGSSQTIFTGVSILPTEHQILTTDSNMWIAAL
jgi:hypothetical protein